MATIPTQEQILLQISQSLGIDTGQTRNKNNFVELKKPLASHKEMSKELLDEIFSYLGLDDKKKAALFQNTIELFSISKLIEMKTWTYNAQQKHILWFCFAYIYAPGIGRNIAFWELAKSMDIGMTYADFWYLPKETNDKLILPVQQVMDWVMDLLETPFDELKLQFKNKRIDTDSIEKNLYNWWKKGSLPQADKIEEYFSEGTPLVFKGCFELYQCWNLEKQYELALSFINKKNINIEDLKGQKSTNNIQSLDKILAGNGSKNDQKELINQVTRRYKKPELKVIRQRLLIARAMQDGYTRLQNILTPDVDKFSTNLSDNKILQLIHIVKNVYQLTIQSTHQSKDWEKQDQWFEKQLPELDKFGIYMSILPSQMKHGSDSAVAETLTHKFEYLSSDSPLEDIIPISTDKDDLIRVFEQKAAFIDLEQNKRPTKELINNLRTKSPYKTLQKIDNFALIRNITSYKSLSPKVKIQAIQRLKEIAQTEREKLDVIGIEINNYQYGLQDKKTKETEKIISSLIDSAKKNREYKTFKAIFLKFEAKHFLAQNKFDEALQLFKKAQNDCLVRSYGDTRGKIAQDAFAVEIANKMVIPGNHENYLRNMLFYGILDTEIGQFPAIEDVASRLYEYFWNDLYKPYIGYPHLKPESHAKSEKWFEEATRLIISADWEGFNKWMNKHSKTLNNKRFFDVRGDTVLTLWIKMRNHYESRIPDLKQFTSGAYKDEIRDTEAILRNWGKAITIISKKWKKLINLSDFKGQTPLMFAANNGDYELLAHFLKLKGDPNRQDYRNRHPLYLAALSGNLECIQLLLEHGADPLIKASKYEHTVLFPAIASGNMRMVKALLDHSPTLIKIGDIDGETPLDCAKSFNSENTIAIKNAMMQENRAVGTALDYKDIEKLLSEKIIH